MRIAERKDLDNCTKAAKGTPETDAIQHVVLDGKATGLPSKDMFIFFLERAVAGSVANFAGNPGQYSTHDGWMIFGVQRIHVRSFVNCLLKYFPIIDLWPAQGNVK